MVRIATRLRYIGSAGLTCPPESSSTMSCGPRVLAEEGTAR